MDITTRRSHSPRRLAVPARRAVSSSPNRTKLSGAAVTPFATSASATMKDIRPIVHRKSAEPESKVVAQKKLPVKEKRHTSSHYAHDKSLEGVVSQKKPSHTSSSTPVAPIVSPALPHAEKPELKKEEASPAPSKGVATKKDTAAKKKRRLSWRSIVGYAACVALLSITASLGHDVWTTNSSLKAELVATRTALASPSPDVRQSNEGKDEAQVPKDAVKAYKVAPTMPRVITIPKANVYARLLPMDVNPDNSMQAPINIYDAGWYTGSAKPGDPGAAVIDAHASGLTRLGLFAYLDTLKAGDLVYAERGDGQKYTYEVVHTEKVARDAVDMQKLLRPYDNVAQGLNLITCAGTYLKDEKTYDHRVVVYTKRVE